MTDATPVFLNCAVVAEPLINQWYAVPLLVSPVSSALLFGNKFLPVLRSFVARPQDHADALRNPAFAGGPFVNIDVGRVNEVQALVTQIERTTAEALLIPAALRQLELALQGTAGESLEPLYAHVPAPLRGLVELTYDFQHRPRYRIVEALAYRSSLYRRDAQAISFTVGSEIRPFIYSTPRLGGEDRWIAPRPFDDPTWDAVFGMRSRSRPLGELRESLCWPPDELLQRLVTTEPPRPCPRPIESGVRVRYFGHSCVLIQTPRVSILTDPGISANTGTVPPRFTFSDLPERIDYVLLSHAHPDHVWLECLLQLRQRIGTVLVPAFGAATVPDISLRRVLSKCGIQSVHELTELQTFEIDGGAITSLPAFGEHGDLDIRCKNSFLIKIDGRAIMVLGDANAPDPCLYERMQDLIKPLDMLFIGMESLGAPMSWAYGAFFSSPVSRKIDQSRRLASIDCDRAMPLIDALQPKRVCVYSMGREPWVSHVMGVFYSEQSAQMVGSERLMELCRRQNIEADRPFGAAEYYL